MGSLGPAPASHLTCALFFLGRAQGGEELTEEAVESVLEEVRPFLSMAGGSIDLVSLNPTGLAPTCTLKMEGSGAALTSVKVEIQQRLKRKLPSLANIMWAD